jgi:hypothetical protein
MSQQKEEWEIWYPKAAATGLLFARCRVDAQIEHMLVHAAPEVLTAVVRGEGQVQSEGIDLGARADTPIARLSRRGDRIEREDIWPGLGELGLPVLLAGGEVGILKQWWHAEDHSEWRWQIELYNHR